MPTEEPPKPEKNDTEVGFFSDIDVTRCGLNEEELKEAQERAERKISKPFCLHFLSYTSEA